MQKAPVLFPYLMDRRLKTIFPFEKMVVRISLRFLQSCDSLWDNGHTTTTPHTIQSTTYLIMSRNNPVLKCYRLESFIWIHVLQLWVNGSSKNKNHYRLTKGGRYFKIG